MRGAVGICARVPVSVFRRWWLRGHARHGKGDSSPVCEHGTCRRLVPRKTMPVSRYRCNDVPYRTPLEFHSGAHVIQTNTWQRQSATQTPRGHTLVHAESTGKTTAYHPGSSVHSDADADDTDIVLCRQTTSEDVRKNGRCHSLVWCHGDCGHGLWSIVIPIAMRNMTV